MADDACGLDLDAVGLLALDLDDADPFIDWPDVQAAELFDYKALGYEYDAMPRR